VQNSNAVSVQSSVFRLSPKRVGPPNGFLICFCTVYPRSPNNLTILLSHLISISTCLPSTPQNISFSKIISWFCIVTLLRLCGLCNSSAILATLKKALTLTLTLTFCIHLTRMLRRFWDIEHSRQYVPKTMSFHWQDVISDLQADLLAFCETLSNSERNVM